MSVTMLNSQMIHHLQHSECSILNQRELEGSSAGGLSLSPKEAIEVRVGACGLGGASQCLLRQCLNCSGVLC